MFADGRHARVCGESREHSIHAKQKSIHDPLKYARHKFVDFIPEEPVSAVKDEGEGLCIEMLVAALRKIEGLEPIPFDFPSDWTEQIRDCKECERWKGHPIQQGICDRHRRPLWQRKDHENAEAMAIGPRAQSIARETLQQYRAGYEAAKKERG